MQPVVSIICMTYNHEAFIGQAMGGFLAQVADFPIEVIVHDDASTDKTPELLRAWARAYPDAVFPLFQRENQLSKTGVYPIVHAYEAARGKYIALCDGDDYWTDPWKLQRQVDFMEANPEHAMCHHDYLILDQGGLRAPDSQAPRDFTGDELVGLSLVGYGIGCCTKLFRNFYAEARKDFTDFIGDYPMNVMLGLHGHCKYIPGIRPSVYRRQHGANSWSGLPKKVMAERTREMHRQVYERICERGDEKHIRIRRAFL